MPSLKLLCRDPVGTARALFRDAGKPIAEERALGHGVQFRFASGAIVSVFSSGAVVPQGAKTDAVARFFAEAVKKPLPAPLAADTEVSGSAPEAGSPPPVAQPEPAPQSYRSPDWDDGPWDGSVPF